MPPNARRTTRQASCAGRANSPAPVRATLRPYDKLYRWGGDEFRLIMPSARATDGTARLTEVLANAALLPMGQEGTPVQLGVSLGAADYTSAETFDETIQLADEAMY